MSASPAPKVVIVGAGPAGLTAAYALVGHGVAPLVLEADPDYVGGISRTATYKGYHFDIGGHRFFSKSREIEDLWTEILGDDLLVRSRSSRIYYNEKFFSYPLKPIEALMTLGPVDAVRCLVSYLWAKARPFDDPRNFEQWVINQFGRRLYEIFFKHYTEKVWGMPCTAISADWAAQRIKGLSLVGAFWDAVKSAVGQRQNTGGPDVVKTLITQFRYPRKGPGMLWERCKERVEAAGGTVRMGRRVDGLELTDDGWLVHHHGQDGQRETERADHVICSAPMREMVRGLRPQAPEAAVQAANALKYRDFLTVAVIVRDRGLFDDNWIYIQDPDVKVGRIQNFKSWSPEMVPDPTTNCYGLEYFCFEGDGLWTASEEELVALAKNDLDTLGLIDPGDVLDATVVRQPKAYPVYDDAYADNVDTIRCCLESDYPNLHLVGRNGMHRYNNQDHAMMTALLTVENIVDDDAHYDVWRVNQDAEYIEKGTPGEEELIEKGGRDVPRKAPVG